MADDPRLTGLISTGLNIAQSFTTANTPFSTSKIVDHVNRNWFARAQYYTVSILGGGKQPDSTEDVMLNCDALQIPGINLSVVSEKRFGIGLQSHYPNGKSYTEATLNFYESEFENERKYFTQWMDKIYNPITMKYEFFNNYAKTVLITQYNRKGAIVYTCALNQAWPTNIGQLDRGYTHDNIVTFPVSIQFYDMTETFYGPTSMVTGSSETTAVLSGLNSLSGLMSPNQRLGLNAATILNSTNPSIPINQPQGQSSIVWDTPPVTK